MSKLRSMAIIGGGPAGLYAAILMRRRMPQVAVTVYEQNPRGATFGFGVVFSDQALGFLKATDPEIHDLILPHMERWQNMTLNHPEDRVVLDGVGFTALGRLELIEILREHAEGLGIDIRFDTRIEDLAALEADIVLGADGLNSVVRAAFREDFAPQVEHFNCHFAWFGADRPFDTLTQSFIRTDKGPMNAHHYRYTPDRSTFIVECEYDTFERYGFGEMGEEESAALCQALFADVLQGARLITNKSVWRQFPRMWCEHWVHDRYVIVGDAAHTAHFSIGSGTRLALEDVIALVGALEGAEDWRDGLAAFEAARLPIARKIVDAANTSAAWYDSFGSKIDKPPLDFAFDYITRSGRVDMDRLRSMAPEFAARYAAEKRAHPDAIIDPVGDDIPAAQEIGFDRMAHPNCSETLWQNLARNPDKAAVIGPAGTLTYAELIAEAARWGHAFAGAGLERGARIPFFMDDTPAYPAAFFGAVRAGFVPVLLNTQTPDETLTYFLKDSGATMAVCEAALAAHFGPAVLEGTDVRTVITVNGTAKGFTPASAFLDGRPTTLEAADTGPDDMAFWMYSSGSTGRPKGIVHLHHDMAYTQQSFGQQVLKLRPDDICFSVPKIFFAYGFGNSITFPYSIGATTLLMPGQPRAVAVIDMIETYRPTVFFGLPTLFTSIARSPRAAGADFSSLRQSMSAAEILSEDVYQAWTALTGHGPTEGLGSTELLHVYLSNRLDDHRPGAAGARVPGYEVKLVTPEGALAGPGEEGVMYVRGHSSAPQYWNRPDKTRDTMRGDWIYTGDRFLEKDGYYYFQGRADELIKVSGQWVWPGEVEKCLAEHPDIHECAVLAHALADKRMTLRAVVHLREGVTAGAATDASIKDWVKDRLQPFKYPRLIEYRDALPKTGTGKIDRRALAAPAPQAEPAG
ncbi:benzoate-CoA ligase family protein [Mesobacterium pallidum]|uniref:benzoate-CoA ligase family protein n=1 Tax=Mesobacterium pallidum TaxID=2872037 RepID=UPI002342EE3B|nr:benzoate-CoA ligase family protein [Mesobacterium pallidum]